MGDIFTKIITAAGVIVGSILTIVTIAEGDPEPMAVALGFFAAATWGTIRLRNKRKLKEEQQLLQLAVRNEGQLTLAEAALDLNIPVERIKKRLEHLETQGVLGFEITDSGELVYSISNTLDIERRRLMEDYFMDDDKT